MEDEAIYKLNEGGNSVIESGIETMDEWLTNMSDEILTAFHRICNKNPDNRSDSEDYEICKHALVLYCRELELDELAVTAELISKISGAFCANIIFESLIRNGLASKERGPLLLYKNCSIELTDKGKEFLKEQVDKNGK